LNPSFLCASWYFLYDVGLSSTGDSERKSQLRDTAK
jgi:hypothetical protein